MAQGFGEVDYGQLNRVKSAIEGAAGRYIDTMNLQTQLAKDKAEKDMSENVLKGYSDVYNNPDVTPDQILRSATQAHAQLAPLNGPIANAAKAHIDKSIDLYSKFKQPEPKPINEFESDVVDKLGNPIIQRSEGVAVQKINRWNPIKKAWEPGWKKLDIEHLQSGNGYGPKWVNDLQKETADVATYVPDPNKRTTGDIRLEKITEHPAKIAQRAVSEAQSFEKALEPYTTMPQTAPDQPPLSLDNYVTFQANPDGSRTLTMERPPSMKDPELQKIPMQKRKMVVSMIESWQKNLGLAYQYSARGYGAAKPNIGPVTQPVTPAAGSNITVAPTAQVQAQVQGDVRSTPQTGLVPSQQEAASMLAWAKANPDDARSDDIYRILKAMKYNVGQ
jgi:hypothetical protein